MGRLVDGKWDTRPVRAAETDGRFKRKDSSFRGRVTDDGSSGFKAEAGRYHLYVSLACPWAHRTLIFRNLKRLESAIGLSIVDWLIVDDGWVFSEREGCVPDTVNGAAFMRDLYVKAMPDYTGPVTVPVLWDKATGTIVNNESSEIIRMLNSEFDAFGDASLDFYPAALRSEIDAINARVYDHINNGVYKTGFARSQAAYEEAYDNLFRTLDEVEARLGRQRYLVGSRITEADWRLFATLIRFDAVYHGHFKCNRQRIADYANLSNYTRDLYQVPGIAETVNMHHIKGHYYASHRQINPSGIVPKGPVLDFTAPHDRARFAA